MTGTPERSAFTAIIPARYASSRLPGKPLADIGGRPMVVRVAEQAAASGAARVVVATDDARIAEAVRAHGVEVVMTRADHVSGTDRLAETASLLGLAAEAIVVNVQGDEPLIHPELVRQVAEDLARHPQAVMSTACHAIGDWETFLNPNVVKVVSDHDGHALYFSRAPIPWPRDAQPGTGALPAGFRAWRHIGLYAYRAGFLARYPALPVSGIERSESLEQLRALDHGFRISVITTDLPPAPGVDTAEDLARVRGLVQAQQ